MVTARKMARTGEDKNAAGLDRDCSCGCGEQKTSAKSLKSGSRQQDSVREQQTSADTVYPPRAARAFKELFDLRSRKHHKLTKKLAQIGAVNLKGAKKSLEFHDIFSPLDGSLLARVPLSDAEDVDLAVKKARLAGEKWAKKSPRARVKFLRKLRREIRGHADALLDLIQLENGKARAHANQELLDVQLNAAFLGKNGPKALRPQKRPGAVPGLVKVELERKPEGVVGIIAPWNYPFNLALSDALAALVAGNAVVIKPATQTPLCALAARALLLKAGLPADLYQVVPGPGSALGNALVDRVDHVMFTGSSAVGRQVAARAAARLIPCSAELGGKNPAIVIPGADVKTTVDRLLAGCFTNAGQLCLSIERIYVHERMWKKFVPAFVAAAKKLRIGTELKWNSDLGPLISRSQLETVSKQVEEARAKGAQILTGGKVAAEVGPLAYLPTILTGVTADMELCREETFGPVVSLYKVSSVNEAIKAANDTEYGLNACVFGPAKTAFKVARQVAAGSVNVNDAYATVFGSVATPAGGWGQSGLGARHGVEGLISFTRPHSVAALRGFSLTEPKAAPRAWWNKVLRWYIG